MVLFMCGTGSPADISSGNISTMVTSLPSAAKSRAVSQPTNPPPITTTFCPTGFFFSNTSVAVATLSLSIPGTFGIIGLEPVATKITSGFFSLRSSGVTSVFNFTSIFNFFICVLYQSRSLALSFLNLLAEASIKWPPSSPAFS